MIWQTTHQKETNAARPMDPARPVDPALPVDPPLLVPYTKVHTCELTHSVASNSLQLPWAVTQQAPLSVGFSRQEYWSRMPCPPPGDLPDTGIKPTSPASPWYGLSGKESTCQCRRRRRHRFDPWFGRILWRREWLPAPVFLPGESHRQRSLMGYSP